MCRYSFDIFFLKPFFGRIGAIILTCQESQCFLNAGFLLIFFTYLSQVWLNLLKFSTFGGKMKLWQNLWQMLVLMLGRICEAESPLAQHFLADPGKARDCSTNTVVIQSLTDLFLSLSIRPNWWSWYSSLRGVYLQQ